ncbi:hypothetical protein TWF506_003556 [Arthrobotrys conoides]|uniref:Uncharacterized protein n=1 Tax=Arthrobotrys conoides TaxID=74498 RepID=A0AAN8RQF3_9PEZI
MTTTDPSSPRVLHNIEIVSPEIAQFFENIGLFQPPVSNRRKISPSALSPNVSSTAHFIDGGDHFTAATISEPCDFLEIPVWLESQETLEIIGFCPEKAEQIWSLWSRIPADEIMAFDFLQFALEFINDPEEGFQVAINEEDDWNAYMDALGVSTTLKTAILLPEYEESSYHALKSLKQRVEESARVFRSMEDRTDTDVTQHQPI